MNQENRKKNFISQLIKMENASLAGKTRNYNEEVAKETTNEISQEWYDVLGGQLDNNDL
ncbi:hypothetical protein [uncultured Microscilla sp.]|uniref:hypothetical protein n=1 Tax=uncultured Microscilla sp. TaxID=432653 RepID=UPI0026139AB5|nr:hypothetical protein [uncultured Microscilla sp.]